MRGLMIRWITVTCAIGVASYLLDGIQVSGFLAAFLAAAMLGFLNAFFRPILLILTLPINILSLGFFTFVINAAMLKMASSLIPGFNVHGFWTAIFGSLIISIVSFGVDHADQRKGGYPHHRIAAPRRQPLGIDRRVRDGESQTMDTSKALEILGLSGNPSPADIKKAYRQQVKIWHPDRYSDDSALKRLAAKNIQDANLAYAFLRQQMPAAHRDRRPPASAPKAPSDVPPPPPSTPERKKSRRFKAILGSIDLAKTLDRLLRWLQSAPRNRFRPWYRYPATGGKTAGHKPPVDFEQVLQNAMQDRAALKRIHRARRRSSGPQGSDTVPPVAAAAKPRRPERTPSSGEG